MNLFFDCLDTLHRLTLNLDALPDYFRCHQCHQPDQFISHGYVYKKQHNGDKIPVGKRLFCANRYQRSGCGATLRLSLADVVPHLQYTARQLQDFVLALITGLSIATAYQQATGTQEPRHAYRWLDKLAAQLGQYRCVLTRRTAHDRSFGARCRPLQCLLPTLHALRVRFGERFVARYQFSCQWPFLG